MDELLKANFKIKNPVKLQEDKKKTFQEQYKQSVLHSIGGSMVYMERKRLVWEGDS